jgi:hypothetical protein
LVPGNPVHRRQQLRLSDSGRTLMVTTAPLPAHAFSSKEFSRASSASRSSSSGTGSATVTMPDRNHVAPIS